MRSRQVRILSPAKINLFLEVLCRRPDGFHEIKTLLQAIDFCDELTLRPIPRGVRLTTDCKAIPAGGKNLVCKAAALFLRKNKIKSGVAISLKKNIPISAGLGGGSSNAACTLLGLDKLFRTKMEAGDLQEIAEKLGSDVPFFILGKPSIGIGKGGKIIDLESNLTFWVVLTGPLAPPEANKTGRIYKALNLKLTNGPRPISITLGAIEAKSVRALADSLFNRLENVACRDVPLIQRLKSFMQVQGALGTLVSGAGPTVFGIVPDKARGLRLEKKLRERFGTLVWTRLTRTRAHTPAAEVDHL